MQDVLATQRRRAREYLSTAKRIKDRRIRAIQDRLDDAHQATMRLVMAKEELKDRHIILLTGIPYMMALASRKSAPASAGSTLSNDMPLLLQLRDIDTCHCALFPESLCRHRRRPIWLDFMSRRGLPPIIFLH